MKIVRTTLPEVLLITQQNLLNDQAGGYETWNQKAFTAEGLDMKFVQDNESFSQNRRTLRGLHYQAPPFAQTKLVRVVSGEILDVVVDVRKGSPNFGNWGSIKLLAENDGQLWIPKGFLHGFLTLTPNTHVIYKVDNFYNAESNGSVIWNDPDLRIDWGCVDGDVILSDKDAVAPLFSDWESPFFFDGVA